MSHNKRNRGLSQDLTSRPLSVNICDMEANWITYSRVVAGNHVKFNGGCIWRTRKQAESSPNPVLEIATIESDDPRYPVFVTTDGQRFEMPANAKALVVA